ncbi:restriction endonuclease subunit S [Streptomyces sp. ISL-90]|nr:restriction endonuclease subunit S [Streptomyces sp. ISL-90]
MSPTERATLGDLLSESNELQGARAGLEPLTLTEGRGFIAQREKFKKRIALEDTSRYKVVRRGDIAYNPYLLWAGALAQNNRWDEAVVSPAYPVFRATGRADTRYLWHILQAPDTRARFDSISFGAIPRRRRATVPDFLRVEIPLPSLLEQRRIAAILDHADALRSAARNAEQRLSELSESYYRQLFVEGEESGWDSTHVSALVADIPNSIRTGPFGSQLLKEELTDNGVPVIGIENVVSNEFHWGSQRFVTQEKYAQLKRYTVRSGDVLITIMGTTGRCAIVPDDVGVAINTKHVVCITLDRSRCLPQFLRATFLWHQRSRRYLGATEKGAIMAGLNMGLIKAMPVTLPPIEIQAEFTKFDSAVQQRRIAAQRRVDLLDALFASLQHRAFGGDL